MYGGQRVSFGRSAAASTRLANTDLVPDVCARAARERSVDAAGSTRAKVYSLTAVGLSSGDGNFFEVGASLTEITAPKKPHFRSRRARFHCATLQGKESGG